MTGKLFDCSQVGTRHHRFLDILKIYLLSSTCAITLTNRCDICSLQKPSFITFSIHLCAFLAGAEVICRVPAHLRLSASLSHPSRRSRPALGRDPTRRLLLAPLPRCCFRHRLVWERCQEIGARLLLMVLMNTFGGAERVSSMTTRGPSPSDADAAGSALLCSLIEHRGNGLAWEVCG